MSTEQPAPTFALRAVAGVLIWLGGLTGALGLLAGVGMVAVGLAADQGVLGLLGGALPALGGGMLGLAVMAVGQLLGCVAAIEAHARVIARQAAASVEEAARLRAVVMARLPTPRSRSDDAEESAARTSAPTP